MKKRTIILVIAIVLSVVLGIVLSIPTLKCEILTLQHGAEFEFHKEEWGENLKVLEYDGEIASVYFYTTGEYAVGNVIDFAKEGDTWVFERWADALWSNHGNADRVLPQYWWHWFYFSLPRQPYS